jgi:hypothetical protein
MAIPSNAVPAAITHVDARTESEFTTPSTILLHPSSGAEASLPIERALKFAPQ